MRLTLYTDYSLRLLMYLAVRPDDTLVTINEVAEAYGIAQTHLAKVAHQLSLAGLVKTVRGKHGGLRLGRPAAAIGLGDVVRRCEPDTALVPCFEPVCGPCAIVPACGLRAALHRARQAFLEVLDGYTLADLVGRRSQLQKLLSIPARPERYPTRNRSTAR
ncbi:MAG TPA: Rrf2 family transcriptional regulator [Acetobacteraceae bacterium]|nr:Rrf2 family transcriptional regulator [Acetobacteraceae bacterium]